MADELLAAYASETVDATAELRALGTAVATHFVKYMAHTAARPAELELFGQLAAGGRKIPVYKAEHAGCFIIFVLGREADGGLLVTLVYAGRIADHPPPPGKTTGWHASAAPIVAPRLKDFYHAR